MGKTIKTDGAKRAGGKMEKVMHEFKAGQLHSGSKKGPVVTDRAQAIAIGISEERSSKKKHSRKKTITKKH
jgi:hypothetical protein